MEGIQLSLPSQKYYQQCPTKWFFQCSIQTGDRTPIKGWRNLSKFRSISRSFWGLPMFYRQRRFIGDLLNSCCCFIEWKICPFKWKTGGKNEIWYLMFDVLVRSMNCEESLAFSELHWYLDKSMTKSNQQTSNVKTNHLP